MKLQVPGSGEQAGLGAVGVVQESGKQKASSWLCARGQLPETRT